MSRSWRKMTSDGNGAVEPYKPPPDGKKGKYAEDRVETHEEIQRRARETFEDKREEVRKENKAMCCVICVYFAFLVIFTISMLLDMSASSSRLSDHIRDKLMKSYVVTPAEVTDLKAMFPVELGTSPSSIMEHLRLTPVDNLALKQTQVKTINDFWTYMMLGFIPVMYTNGTDQEMARQTSEYLQPIDVANRIVGHIRLRQVRVQVNDACQVSPLFGQYTISCSPRFAADIAATDSYSGVGVQAKLFSHEKLDGSSYSGSYSSYGAGGYIEYLHQNRTVALQTAITLASEGWLDRSTRAVFIEFNVWNSNLGTYAVTRISFEFGATGGVAVYTDVQILSQRSLKPGGIGSLSDWLSLIGIFVVMGFVCWYIWEEVREIYAVRWSYFLDGWNLMDWLNMILLVTAMIFRLIVFATAAGEKIGQAELMQWDIPPAVNEDDGSITYTYVFADLRGLANGVETIKFLNAFNAVLMWQKCVKYLKHLPIVKVLVRTIWDAFTLFLPFLAMFLIAFIGFTIAYNVGFGDKLLELSTFFRAFVYLSRAFLRDVELMPAYHITPIFGAFLILLFYVMLMLVGVNVLFAIVADSMFRGKYYKKEPTEQEKALHEDEPLEEVLRDFSAYIRNQLKKNLKPKWFRRIYRDDPASKMHAEADKVKAKLREELGRHDYDKIYSLCWEFYVVKKDDDHAALADKMTAIIGAEKAMDYLPQFGPLVWMVDTANQLANGEAAVAEVLEPLARMPVPKAVTDIAVGALGDAGKEYMSTMNSNNMLALPGYDEDEEELRREKEISPQEIMRAIEHMSGRVLSEIQEVGIEIRSELHDVCERVAQMQMAVEELTLRTESMRLEQEEVL